MNRAKTQLLAAILFGAAFQGPASAVGDTPARVPEQPPMCAPNRATAPAVSTTTSDDVARLVEDFVRAYNDGDAAGAEASFSADPDFEWYSVSRGRHQEFTTYERSGLALYFARRHEVGDRLKLLEVDVREKRGWHGGYDFSFRLVRFSDQGRAAGRYHGKGAADCTIFVWSMGGGVKPQE